MLRRRLIVINIVFALVMLAITGVGMVLLIRSMDQDVVNMVDIDDLTAVVNAMDNTPMSALYDCEKAARDFPPDFHLLWVDAEGNVLGDSGLDPKAREVVLYKGPRQPTKICGTIFYGIVIVSKTYGTTTLYAVDERYSTISALQRSVTIYIIVVLGALLLIFVGSIVVEIHAIFPRLNRLREAMDQVYNGNYEQTLQLPKGKHRDEINTLLVDFDMLRRKLRDATLAKEAADRERGIVVSGISHDLRTPLTVIKTHSKGLLDGVAQRVGKEQEYIANIYSTALEMENLVAKLADFTKVETRQITYSFVTRDISEHIQSFVDKHYIAYAARGLNLKCKVPKNKKLWVNIDKDQFNRVWQNLCDNSLKYKDKEEAHVLISAELVDDKVFIRVADDGPGIAEYEVEYIFESYYRGDASRTNPTDGSGLGLAIVKNCVMAHNGEIRAYNDNGLTIEIILPYRRKK